jgi:hypothetical protein
MNKETQERYSFLIASISNDFQAGKISWEHYILTLEMIIKNIKNE